MPVISVNFTHEQYNKLVEGARKKTDGNVSEYIRDYCVIKDKTIDNFNKVYNIKESDKI